jgi:Lon protease-like protein
VTTSDIPLFPLQTVLVPGGYLPLQIFEPRYLDMVRDCVRDESGFGVCLVLDGNDPTQAAHHVRVGTLALIRDWNMMENGLLGITARGQERFRVRSTRMRDNGLMIGAIELITEPEPVPVPDELLLLSRFVDRFMDKLSAHYPDYAPQRLEDASWVGYRLTELLPLKNLERQGLLELDDPVERLEHLLKIIPRFQ